MIISTNLFTSFLSAHACANAKQSTIEQRMDMLVAGSLRHCLFLQESHLLNFSAVDNVEHLGEHNAKSQEPLHNVVLSNNQAVLFYFNFNSFQLIHLSILYSYSS